MVQMFSVPVITTNANPFLTITSFLCNSVLDRISPALGAPVFDTFFCSYLDVILYQKR